MNQRLESLEQGMEASTFASLLAGKPPVITRPPPEGAVRRHSLDHPNMKKPPEQPASGANGSATKHQHQGFSAADKAFIRRVHGYMTSLQLLGIINERLVCDQGADAKLFTIEQLHAEISSVASAVPAGGNDWGSLRKVLSKARRAGVLDLINEEVINDFAVVYSLNQKQVITLKDILLNRGDAES